MANTVRMQAVLNAFYASETVSLETIEIVEASYLLHYLRTRHSAPRSSYILAYALAITILSADNYPDKKAEYLELVALLPGTVRNILQSLEEALENVT